MFEELKKEVSFRTSRSSGAGGQHVNKVSTRVELLFDIFDSKILTTDEKEKVKAKLKNRISSEGILMLACEETRSQAKNKAIVLKRFLGLVEDALQPEKPRKPTKPTKASVLKRLKDKKKIAEKKDFRKPVSED